MEYLVPRLWSEREGVIVATSCNRAGEGKPRSAEYAMSCVNAELRLLVDLEIDAEHRARPELDEDGRWMRIGRRENS